MDHQKIKEGVKNTFDNVASSYDTNRHFIISAKGLVEHIDIDKPSHILDISTGTGHIAIELAKKFPNTQIHAVDISNEMLNIAKEKTKNEGITNISFYLQDVENLEFDDIEFDVVTCGYGLFFYPDMDKVFCDICSRLKTGGRFLFTTFNDNAFQPYSQIFLDMLKEGYKIAPPSKIESRQLKTQKEIEELSNQFAHDGLNVHDLNIRFPMEVDEWWSLLNTTGYKSLLAQLKDDYTKFEKEYLSKLDELSNDGKLDFNADSLISIVKVK